MLLNIITYIIPIVGLLFLVFLFHYLDNYSFVEKKSEPKLNKNIDLD